MYMFNIYCVRRTPETVFLSFISKTQRDILVKLVVDLMRRNPHLNPVTREFISYAKTKDKLQYNNNIFLKFNLLDFRSEHFATHMSPNTVYVVTITQKNVQSVVII